MYSVECAPQPPIRDSKKGRIINFNETQKEESKRSDSKWKIQYDKEISVA